MRSRSFAIFTAVSIVLAGSSLFFGTRAAHAADPYTLLGWSEYGMHTIDSDYSVFSLSPPHNIIHAQLIDASGKLVKSGDNVTVTYEAAADSKGNLNSTSDGKTNFWQYANTLFGFSGAANEGMNGANMPGAGNAPQPMAFDGVLNRFSARGIPITPKNDDGATTNYYPVMKLVARDASGALLASTRISLPVSDEMQCRACHASGSKDAAKPEAGWVNDENPERDFRLNILRAHDDHNLNKDRYIDALTAVGYSTDGLFQTATSGTPVVCVKCHASNSPTLNSPGITGLPALTSAIHKHHATVADPDTGVALDDQKSRGTCYRCHAGANSKSLRGAMGHSVAADGSMAIECQSCHGNLSAVADPNRKGWLTLPNCQACHTGTAVTAIGGSLRNYTVFGSDGNMVAPSDTTFATTPNQPADGATLFRASTGHGGLMCQACHGPTHAESPSNQADENAQSTALQGSAGAVQECTVCHRTGVSTLNGGPHGMHGTGQSWITEHEALATTRSRCTPCHGTDFRGTVLSRAFSTHSVTIGRAGTIQMFRGYQVSCYTCHNGPTGSGNAPAAPVVSNTTASATAGQAVTINVTVTNNGVLRIVSQPAGGTAFVNGNVITYQPAADYQGSDKLTYAAINQGRDSNLGTATIQVTAP